MPKAFPKEFREDVIRVYRDSGSSVAQVAKDFGIFAVVPQALDHNRLGLRRSNQAVGHVKVSPIRAADPAVFGGWFASSPFGSALSDNGAPTRLPTGPAAR
ncbi:transposase [Nocardioides ochotonae]|uniref:transposase n=1 Tax=Nocardioides ochotonae TaxID=2685869 RepID=UPI001A9FFAE3|nr:transposase [Nocardioides ochotonae]